MRTARFGTRGGADSGWEGRVALDLKNHGHVAQAFQKPEEAVSHRSLSRFIWALANLSGFGPSLIYMSPALEHGHTTGG